MLPFRPFPALSCGQKSYITPIRHSPSSPRIMNGQLTPTRTTFVDRKLRLRGRMEKVKLSGRCWTRLTSFTKTWVGLKNFKNIANLQFLIVEADSRDNNT